MKRHKRWRKILESMGFKKENYLDIAQCYWNEEYNYRIIHKMRYSLKYDGRNSHRAEDIKLFKKHKNRTKLIRSLW